MTKEEVLGVVRALLAALGGWAASRGYVDSETAVAVGGAVITIIAAVWSVKAKRAA